MMLCSLLLRSIILAQLFIPQAAAAEAASPATQPADQITSTSATSANQDSPGTLLDAFGRTKLGQYAQGKRAVTWQSLQEMRQPGFWVDTIRDMVVALLLLIPRILIAALFLVIFYFLYRGIRKLVLGSLGRAAVDQSIRDMLGTLIKWGVMGFGMII